MGFHPLFETTTTCMVHTICISLKLQFFIPSEYHIMPVIITERPHLPLGNSTTFFLGQLEGELCFPLHLFLCEIVIYFSLPLNQLVPNSWHLLTGFFIVLSYFKLTATSSLFHCFFQLKMFKLDAFFFMARHEI